MTVIPASSRFPQPTIAIPVGEASRDVSLLRRSWNPYLVGAVIGILSWLVFAIADKPLGISTSLSAASGACVIPFIGADGVARNPYWARHMPKWDYGMLFIVG